MCRKKKLTGTLIARCVPFSESHRDNLSVRYREA